MAAEQFANLAATTLNGAINNAVTTVVVASGAAPFPSSAQFRVVVDSEIMLVTAGAGTASWTVTRGAESTTAASHADGAAVTHVLTAGALGVVSDPGAAVPGLRTLGSGATQAAGGTDSRLSDSRAPNGSAGGSLTGTYPNPTIATIPSGATATTQTAADNSTKVATTAYADAIAALKANLASPAFTGHPTGVTESAGDNSTRLASTAYVDTGLALKANIASPTLTGTPAAPTAAQGTNTTQIATTAMVHSEVVLLAPIASPTLTGTPAAPTAAAGTNTTQLATTAFVTTGSRQVVPMIASRWYSPEGVTSTVAMTLNKLYAVPFDFDTAISVTALGLEITTVGGAGSVVRLGIYADSSGSPGSLVLDAGTINGTILFSTTPGAVTGLSQAMGVGRCYLVAVAQTAAPNVRTINSSIHGVQSGTGNQPGSGGLSGYAETGTATSGALPGSFPAFGVNGSVPRVVAKT